MSLYYYMRPIKTTFLDTPNGDEGKLTPDTWNYGLMGVLAGATIAGPLLDPNHRPPGTERLNCRVAQAKACAPSERSYSNTIVRL